MSNYSVLVWNIGNVHDGRNKKVAMQVFNWYVRCSKANHGRAGGESVTLFCDDEIAREYVNPIHIVQD